MAQVSLNPESDSNSCSLKSTYSCNFFAAVLHTWLDCLKFELLGLLLEETGSCARGRSTSVPWQLDV